MRRLRLARPVGRGPTGPGRHKAAEPQLSAGAAARRKGGIAAPAGSRRKRRPLILGGRSEDVIRTLHAVITAGEE